MQDGLDAFRREIGDVFCSTHLPFREQKSRDYYWYSPILTPRLRDCVADVVVQPRNRAELRVIAAAAVRHRLPLTVRGGGTGNYGQCVPIQGGIVVDMTRLNQVLAVDPGCLRIEAGATMRSAFDAAIATGQQIMMFPSTMATATVGGYLSGGFAGIGSIRHGIIRDSGMIQSLTVMSVEGEPRIVTLEGEDVKNVFHSWGTTGIVLEATLKLIPAETWIDCIATFETYGDTIAFGNAIFESGTDVFLLSAVEKRFAPFYKRTQAYFDGSRDAMFSMVAARDVDRFFEIAKRFGGIRAMSASADESATAHLRPIQETAFNHTTLVALKVDPSWTYLQVVMPDPFAPELAEAQLKRFGGEVLMHHEYTREHGRPRIGGLPLVKFTTEARLQEIMASFEADGCVLNNPHVFTLEDGGRFDPEGRKLAFRKSMDPDGLLNPGKLRSIART